MLSGASRDRAVIVGWSTALRGQVINESLEQLPKKLAAGPRVLARTESSGAQSGTKQGGPPHDHWAKLGQLRYTRSQYSFVAIALFSMKFIAPPSTKKELTPERRVYALNSVTLQQQSIGMADPWRTLNRLARAIGDRALAGNVGSASPHARPGPDPPPDQMEVTAAVIAVCSACVLRSLGQIRAGSPQQGFPLRRSICSITTVLQFEVANNLSTNGLCCLVVV